MRTFIVIACIALIVLATSVSPGSAQSTPTSQSLCDMPNMRGTAAYNKYCGSGGSPGSAPATGGGYTPQQQTILNGAQQMMPFLEQGVHDLFYGNPQEEAARKAAAAQAAAEAAAEQQRRSDEAAQRAEAIKNQLLGSGAGDSTSLSLMGVHSDTDLHLMGVENTSDLKLMTGDQTQFFGTTVPKCPPPQDASVVDLCGHGDTVDPANVKIDPRTASGGGAGLSNGQPDTMVQPNALNQAPHGQTATADVVARPSEGPQQKSTAPALSSPELSAAELTKIMPLLRKPDTGGPIGKANRPTICKSLDRQLDETYQLSLRAVLASDVYKRYETDANWPLTSIFNRISDNPAYNPTMRELFQGVDGKDIKEMLYPDNSDYRAAIYQDKTTKKIFVVFRGTEPTSLDDWTNGNADQAFGLSSSYYKKAIALVKILKKSAAAQYPPLELELIGHSLGGGMADAAGVVNQVSATTFNPAGVIANTLPKSVDISTASKYDTDYVIRGEILNEHQDHPPATRAVLSADLVLGGPVTVMAAAANVADSATSDILKGGNGDTRKGIQETAGAASTVLPPAIGRRVTLAFDQADVKSVDPFTLHYMSSVVDAIVAHSRELRAQYVYNECGS